MWPPVWYRLTLVSLIRPILPYSEAAWSFASNFLLLPFHFQGNKGFSFLNLKLMTLTEFCFVPMRYGKNGYQRCNSKDITIGPVYIFRWTNVGVINPAEKQPRRGFPKFLNSFIPSSLLTGFDFNYSFSPVFCFMMIEESLAWTATQSKAGGDSYSWFKKPSDAKAAMYRQPLQFSQTSRYPIRVLRSALSSSYLQLHHHYLFTQGFVQTHEYSVKTTI